MTTADFDFSEPILIGPIWHKMHDFFLSCDKETCFNDSILENKQLWINETKDCHEIHGLYNVWNFCSQLHMGIWILFLKKEDEKMWTYSLRQPIVPNSIERELWYMYVSLCLLVTLHVKISSCMWCRWKGHSRREY